MIITSNLLYLLWQHALPLYNTTKAHIVIFLFEDPSLDQECKAVFAYAQRSPLHVSPANSQKTIQWGFINVVYLVDLELLGGLNSPRTLWFFIGTTYIEGPLVSWTVPVSRTLRKRD